MNVGVEKVNSGIIKGQEILDKTKEIATTAGDYLKKAGDNIKAADTNADGKLSLKEILAYVTLLGSQAGGAYLLNKSRKERTDELFDKQVDLSNTIVKVQTILDSQSKKPV